MASSAGLRYAVRALGRKPGFTAAAVLSLALGIGANTAIFSLINALMLRELPVREPERLVEISALRSERKVPLSYPMFRELERHQRVFSALIGWTPGALLSVDVNGAFAQATVDEVSGGYYAELGVVPLMGRLIGPGDERSPVAVLGYQYWQRRFGGASGVIGRPINIEGRPHTIIGVTRKWFTGMTTGQAPEVTVPMQASDNRALLRVWATGRLQGGVTLAQARAQLASFWPDLLLATVSTETPGLRRQAFLSMKLDVEPAATGIARDLRAQFRRPLYVLLGIVGLILLVACVNVANLMLARAEARSHEMSVRVALGAGRWAIVRQVLAESLTLALAGALAGGAFAFWGSRLLVAGMTEGYLTPVALDLRPDWRVLLFTAGVAVLSGVLFGLAPAWRAARQDPAAVLQHNARSLGGAAGRLGRALMVVQVALSLVLLMGAGLLARSFERLVNFDRGFEENVLQVNLYPKPGALERMDTLAYRRQLLERLASAPGVHSAAFSDLPGPGLGGWQEAVSAAASVAGPNTGVMATMFVVSPGFFRTLGVRLLRGRDFDWRDDEGRPLGAIVSSDLAVRLAPAGDIIGRRIRFGVMPEYQNLEVVGVVSRARLVDLHDAASPVVWLAYSQYPQRSAVNLFLRVGTNPEAAARTSQREIEAAGREYVVQSKTIAHGIGEALAGDRVIAMLSGFFAALALLLASVGLYGLTSYTVTRRTREIGIRAALGARPADVRRTILREALKLVLAGIAIGIPCALGATRLIAGMLFGVSPADAATLAGVALLLSAVTALASWVPALRASRIDPMAALRTE